MQSSSALTVQPVPVMNSDSDGARPAGFWAGAGFSDRFRGVGEQKYALRSEWPFIIIIRAA